MKFRSTISTLCISAILIGASCQKIINCQPPNTEIIPRKVQFWLYTDEDLSGDSHLITFRLSIQNSVDQTLWDSVLAPIKIKDIPTLANKLVVEKEVPQNNTSLLKVGFYYSIEDVGNSWHLDAFSAGETFKIVDFNFH